MISKEIGKIQQNLASKKLHNIKAVILYGSWVKGTAREDSDVDLLAIYRRRDKKAVEVVDKLANEIGSDREFTIIHASIKDFEREKLPLYTAAKKEGKVIHGNVDVSISKVAPSVKYAEFFEKSREFESCKVELAQKLLLDGLSSGVVDYCFIASKHAIQAALAMRGKGYSSKMDVLLPLAKECFGENIFSKFKKCFEIYKKSGGLSVEISGEEAKSAVKCAKEVIKVYMMKGKRLILKPFTPIL